MDIIQYLLSFIQYQHQQICWLLNFICRYIPLKQWAFDDSHSPKYQKFKDDFKFTITQVIGLTNDDEVSKEFRPYKQMIERLNRTYKASYRTTNGFDNYEGANYDLALWVAYYNFLRPHKHNHYQVLNKADMLNGADNMPGKWQLLIFLGQQTILNLQTESSNCS